MQFIRVPANVMSTSRRTLLFGKGVNDASYIIQGCPVYAQWKAVLQRAFCAKWQKRYPCYEGTSVVPEWLHFSAFLAWADAQPSSGVIDKDLLVHGNKQYGPTTCMLIPQEINKLVIRPAVKTSGLPVGVDLLKGRYLARTRMYGKPVSLGMHDTAEAAHKAFIEAKAVHVREVAETQHQQLKYALHRIADQISTGNYYK